MLKSFVRRAGRFTPAQRKAYDGLSEKFMIPFCGEKLDLSAVFGNTRGVTLEIGFGMGKATVEIAEANPLKNYLGVEVHRPGIGKLLLGIESRSLSNIRIMEYDAVPVMEKMIAEGALDAIHVFFPDPWPKKKHHKRRLIRRPFTETLAKSLKPGGYLYMVTDWEDYALRALEELSATASLRNKFESFASPQDWRPKTRFEEKGLQKEHKIRELYFVKT
jgi:tRNA (guanine-N7-)-methyltransferase